MIVNWMEALVRTYDACIGDLETRNEPVPLVPICHTLNNMHITVTVDGDGGFVSAEVVPKEEQNTMHRRIGRKDISSQSTPSG